MAWRNVFAPASALLVTGNTAVYDICGKDTVTIKAQIQRTLKIRDLIG